MVLSPLGNYMQLNSSRSQEKKSSNGGPRPRREWGLGGALTLQGERMTSIVQWAPHAHAN